MNIFTNTITGFLSLSSTCEVSGRNQIHTVNCSEAHLNQIIKKGLTGCDAVYIAQDRYKEAMRLKRRRLNERRWRKDAADQFECDYPDTQGFVWNELISH